MGVVVLFVLVVGLVVVGDDVCVNVGVVVSDSSSVVSVLRWCLCGMGVR